MNVEADLIRYHKSIAGELKSTRDRIRNLIGARHWLSDGEHKEAVLRKVLRNHVPESVRVGRGFVFFGKNSSNQMDILITNRNKPTLFKEDDLTIATRDAVQAIIEVKTKIDSIADLEDILTKLANNVELIRGTKSYQECWAGLFAFEEMPRHITQDAILQALYKAARQEPNRVINAVVLGQDTIVRFVDQEKREEIPSPAWLVYHLEDLAQAYFVSYAVWSLTPESAYEMRTAWFPLIRTQKYYVRRYISLYGGSLGDPSLNLIEQLKPLVKAPHECTADEITDFVDAVGRSGQVAKTRLRSNVENAKLLMSYYDRSKLVAVGAIKQPPLSHRQKLFSRAQSQENAQEFVHELGWLYVDDHYRGKGIAKNIVSELLTSVDAEKIYATAREDDFKVQKILRLYGFEESGHPFKSKRGSYHVRLFIRI